MLGSCSDRKGKNVKVKMGINSDLKADIEALKLYRSNGHLSEILYEKLYTYLSNGGTLDIDDQLFYIMKKFENDTILSIELLQIERNSEILFEEKQIYQILIENGFFAEGVPIINFNTRKIIKKKFVEESIYLALEDKNKIFYFDLEGDVMKENLSYTYFLEEMKSFTLGHFSPSNIQESWETNGGPIVINYTCENKIFTFSPSYNDDWYDISECMKQINEILKAKGYGIYTISAEFISGQDVLFIFLSDTEKENLKERLGWQLDLIK